MGTGNENTTRSIVNALKKVKKMETPKRRRDDPDMFISALRHKAYVTPSSSQSKKPKLATEGAPLNPEVHSPLPSNPEVRSPLHVQPPKVTSKWKPSEGQHTEFLEAPVFFPDQEEFADLVKYIASIRPLAEHHGICRIVPPKSYRPSAFRGESVGREVQFTTRIQPVHLLQNRPPGDFGFDKGPKMNLWEFKQYADEFKQKYFEGTPDPKGVEAEFWRIVEKSTENEQVKVLYGADIDTRSLPEAVRLATTAPGNWNLGNIARQPRSVLSFETSDISGVIVPWLYVGMSMSSFCWHVEDHFLYSINYMHHGDAKIWYGVPRSNAVDLENVMKRNLPELFKNQRDLLHKLTTQFPPAVLKENGIHVCRAVQRAGDFIVTFPRAYHCGLNTGFNIAESVNIAPMDWLLHGHSAIELYQRCNRKASISHDRLLLSAAKHFLSVPLLSKEELLSLYNALKVRVQTEDSRRRLLVKARRTRKMDAVFDAGGERECPHCSFDLHLSCATCECNEGNGTYVCLEHLNAKLCKCPEDRTYALYRMELSELYDLQRKLEMAAGLCPDIDRELHLELPEPPQEEPPAAAGESPSQSTDVSQRSEQKSTQSQLKSPPSPSVKAEYLEDDPHAEHSSIAKRNNFMEVPSDQLIVLSDDDDDVEAEVEADVVRCGTEESTRPSSSSKSEMKIELLNAGAVVDCCDEHTIFPSGFKSRVMFYDYTDLPRRAYYVSEIIVNKDENTAFFKVSLENQKNQCVVTTSAEASWKAIQDRIYFEAKQLGLSRDDVQAEISSGLAMFGLTDTRVKRAIEALDFDRCCKKYWREKDREEQEQQQQQQLEIDDKHLRELFRKGSKHQLRALYRCFGIEWGSEQWKRIYKLLSDELEIRVNSGGPW